MLQLQVDRILNPLLRLELLFEKLPEDQVDEKSNLVYQAFLFTISNLSAFKFDKKAKLDRIASVLPDGSGVPDQGRMISAFEEFCKHSFNRNEIVTVAELKWVDHYITDPKLRKRAECCILRSLLSGDECWDQQIEEYDAWTLTEAEKAEVAGEVLNNAGLIRNKRKAQLAKRYGFPAIDYLKAYLRKLLWDRHYDNAEKLIGENDELTEAVVSEVAETVIYENLNAGYIRDAYRAAVHFFPSEQGFYAELDKLLDIYA